MDDARGKIHNEMKGYSDFHFKKVGLRKGEWQISSFLGLITIKNLFNILRFNVINPITGMIQEHIIFESKPTAVLVVIVNKNYVILSKQHRPIFSRWFIELIRGWVQDSEDALEPLRRKIPQLLGDSDQEIKGIAKLSNHKPIIKLYECAEDTGWRSNNKSLYIINVETDKPVASAQELQQQLRDRRNPDNLCKPCVSTIKELDQHAYGLMFKNDKKRGLIECQSLGAWFAFYYYRNPPFQQ